MATLSKTQSEPSIQQASASTITPPPTAAPIAGLLYVDAYFTNPTLSPAAYERWYNDSHIPHLLTMGGCHAASRYTDVDPDAKIPLLTLYPLKDVAWVHSAEFGTAIESTRSDEFPGQSVFLNVAFDGRSYTLVEETKGEISGDTTSHIILTSLRAPTHSTPSPDPAWKTLSSLRRARRYNMHVWQPEEWKERWRDLGMPGGWPERDMIIHEFGPESEVEQIKVWAKEIEEREKGRGLWDEVTARVYRLTDNFGDD